MAKRGETRRIRDLPPETQREIRRQKAQAMMEQVKIDEAKAKQKEHQALVQKLKEGG